VATRNVGYAAPRVKRRRGEWGRVAPMGPGTRRAPTAGAWLRSSPPLSSRLLNPADLPAETPAATSGEKDLEKVQEKLLASRRFAPPTCVGRGRQGAGLTYEGTAGRHPRRNLMGRRQGPPGWGKRGLQSGPCRQAVRPKGRRGAASLPGGQRGGTRRAERDPAGPWLTYEGTAARGPPATGPGRSGEPRRRSRASGRDGARQGRRRVGGPRSPAASRAAVEGKAARLAIRTAVHGWRLRGAPPRAAGKSRGAGTGA
jgi:hypothetical protein